jgi:amino acid permease
VLIRGVGVAISYLIIIGDLMPQVVRGFSDGLVEYAFLVDRHFWITAFMFTFPFVRGHNCFADVWIGSSLFHSLSCDV